ncbi:MAG: lamin tail domain-containing protein, partial [Cyanobacteria bacterium J06642_2]
NSVGQEDPSPATVSVPFALPIPETDDINASSQSNPGGTTQVQVPNLSGSDPIDGTLGTGDSFKIVTLSNNGDLFYNGSAVTVGQTITNYDPALLTLDPDDGAITVEFTYAAINSVGQEDPSPATVSVPFALPIPETDLALSFDPLSAQPLQGFSFPVVLTVINEDPTIGANGVTVSLPIPNGYQYLSDDAAGGYDPDTGVWTIGNLPAGDSVDLTLNLAPLASGTYELEAEVSTLDETDTDSTPGNGVAGEDDIDTLEPTPTRGIGDTPPTLLCAPGFETLDWDLFSSTWIVSAPDQTVVGDRGTPIRVQFSGDIADMDSFDHALNNGFTGGLTPAEFSLRYFENFANRSQNVINTFDIGVPGIGVDELSFRIFDVDVLRSSGWADSLEVVGFLNGTSVLPTITSEGNSHSVSGNQVEGLINANNSTANGTVFVAFDSPIDRLVITTRPGNLTPGDNPGNQGVAIHDLSFCPSEDYGDAPDTYGTDITAGNSGSDPVGPSHTIASDLFFGASIPDAETNGFVDGTDDNGDATDDDDPVGTGTGNGDDEDGIAAFPTLTEGVNSYTIPASSIGVTNTSTEAATLHAWIDFNNSGTFEPAEYASVTVNSGTNGGNPAAALEWNGISVGSAGNTYARFRLTTDGSIDATTPGGAASDGEVEDYQVTIVTAPSTDFGDAPVTYDDTSGDGSIDGSDTPAEHAITNILNLGSVAPDDETAPQSSAAADGDDDATAPAIDDEDGVTVFPTIDSGATSYSLELSVNNDSGSAANVYAWIDFDLDGEFDEDERATVADGSIALSGGQVPTGSNGTVTLNWDNIGTTNDITNGDSFVRVRVTTDDLDITTETTGRDDAAVGSASDGEIEDFPLAIANAQVISPAAGDIVINEVLFRQTGSGAAGNDEFIELFNASNTPVDISGWQLLDGNLPANDTDGIGGINGNSGPFVFPAGTVVNPGAYVVVWVGTETPQKQADDAAFEFYLGQSSKLNNSGDDVWLYDADTAIVDYIAYGTNNGINTPPNAALNLWDDSFQSVIDNTSQVGQSISLTPNGQDGNISGCWEPTTSGDAETPSARCPGSLPTRDTDSVTDRITSVGVSNNGSPLILLVKRITAVNGIDIAGFDSNDGRTDDDDPNWPAPNSAFLRGAVSSGTVAPGDEVEFTIYFLSAGGSSVTNLTLCDLVPDNMTFVADAFQGQAPLDTNSLSGTDVGIALASDNTILPTAPTVYLTNVGEGDRGEFFPPNTAAPGTCNVADTSVSLPASSNLRGAVVVQVVDSSNTLPNATASGAPPDSYGFIRFRAIVD